MTNALVLALTELGVTPESIASLLAKQLIKVGLPQKVLLTPAEAAWALGGFSERAFEQAEWRREIPVVKIGIKNFYRYRDLEDFAANHVMQPLRARKVA